MKILFERTFLHDLEKVKDKRILKRVRVVIAQAASANSTGDIQDINVMRDYKSCCRINLGNYRMGIQILRRKLIFVRLIHRKDMYRYFP
ncbi:MAG: type II toxin-antitoxin system RelE/ParE family toxin [Chloroflexi bacterium]|nr:type II toxin-antitoxin system RelE/ParE family toxin [Chloroflexota bacterium]